LSSERWASKFGKENVVAIVSAQHVQKRYGSFVAVRDLSFTVEAGECFAFLGPNGAGKSSTIRMICCQSPVSAGTLTVFGQPAHPHALAIKRRLGVVAQDDYLDAELTVQENLMLHGMFYGLGVREARRRSDELLEFMQLEGKRRQRVRELSGGMRRRLVIARGLIGRPDLLVLDEPTTGLDPQARILVWGRLRELVQGGVTLIVTTHYMEEAARLADRLVVMDHGEILDQGRPQDLVERVAGTEAVDVWGLDAAAVAAAVGEAGRVESRGDGLAVLTRDSQAVLERLSQAPRRPERLQVRPASLEDVFLLLTGKELRE
jgi:lipooligosaccharide transport system ATP-binding protein